MLVLKAILVICFLCVGFSWNWLNADKSQNYEKVDRSIPSIFGSFFLLLCGNIALNPGPTNFGFGNCRFIRNKGPILYDLIKCSDLDILGLVKTHIRPTNTDGLLSCLTPVNHNFIQKPKCTGLGGDVGFLCRKTFFS